MTLPRLLLTALTAAGLAISLGSGAHAATWSLAGDFSGSSNPNGAWSYGWSSSRGSAFNLSTGQVTGLTDIDGWRHPSIGELSVFHNFGSTTANYATWHLPAGKVALHPGPSGENAVVRWTAPANGSYRIEISFTGIDDAGPTNTDVAVLHGATEVFSGFVNSYNVPVGHTSTRTVQAGETIDVTVGPNGSYAFDSTMVEITITTDAPEAVAPTMAFTAPKAGAYLKNFSAGIAGTASDNTGGSGVASVAVQLERASDGKFWNPVSGTWEASGTLAVSTGDGFATWSVASTLPGGASLTTGVYHIVGTVTDNAGNSRTVSTGVLVDITPPVVAITTPANGASVTNLRTIRGTASDADAGLKGVLVRIKRKSDNKYWDGSTWTSTIKSLATTNLSRWAVTAPLPAGAQLLPGGYSLIAIAYDRFPSGQENTKSVVTSFTVP